jgi:hypothetical protein
MKIAESLANKGPATRWSYILIVIIGLTVAFSGIFLEYDFLGGN